MSGSEIIAAVIGLVALVGLIVAAYFIIFYSLREKTYEEALAEKRATHGEAEKAAKKRRAKKPKKKGQSDGGTSDASPPVKERKAAAKEQLVIDSEKPKDILKALQVAPEKSKRRADDSEVSADESLQQSSKAPVPPIQKKAGTQATALNLEHENQILRLKLELGQHQLELGQHHKKLAIMKILMKAKNNKILEMAHLLHLRGAIERMEQKCRAWLEELTGRGPGHLERTLVFETLIADEKKKKELEAQFDTALTEFGKNIGAPPSLLAKDLAGEFPATVKAMYKKLSDQIHDFEPRGGFLVIDATDLSVKERATAMAVCLYLDLYFQMQISEYRFNNFPTMETAVDAKIDLMEVNELLGDETVF